MVELNLNVGRTYDDYGEQVVKKEKICLTSGEAAYYLQQLIELRGIEFTKDWLKKAKGYEEDTGRKLHSRNKR
tara:strand:+ start:649 stop:867 length:219 start_codon:yes stop_codon:yes gene_type:complete